MADAATDSAFDSGAAPISFAGFGGMSPLDDAVASPKGSSASYGSDLATLSKPPPERPDKDKTLEATLLKYKQQQVGLEGAQTAQQEARDKRNRERQEGLLNQEAATLADLKPWDAKKELSERKTGLWEKFGSPGFIVAMLASAFTAHPMNSALSSGAAAMDAINQGDMAAYDKAMEAWKANTDAAVKRMNIEHEEYADIDKLRETDLSAWQTKMKMAALKFNDKATLAYMDAGMYPELEEKKAGIWEGRQKIAEAQKFIEDQELQRRLTWSLFMPGEHDQKKISAEMTANPQKFTAAAMQAEQMIAALKTPGTPEQQAWRKYKQENPNGTFAEDSKALKDLHQRTMTPQQVALQQFMEQHSADNGGKGPSAEQMQSFLQSGRAARSAIAMYMTRFTQDFEDKNGRPPTAQELKVAAQDYQSEGVALTRFGTGPQGNTVRSLNVVVQHLDTLRQLSDAMDNGDWVSANRIAQGWAAEFGKDAPTNMNAAAQMVGTEVIKALGIAGAGTQDDRDKAEAAFRNVRSPTQVYGVIDKVARPLLLGQLRGLKYQYIHSTGRSGERFEEALMPETRQFLDELHQSIRPEPPADHQDSHPGWGTPGYQP